MSDFEIMKSMLERQQSQKHKREFKVCPDSDYKSFRCIRVTCFYGRTIDYMFDKPELQLSNIITYESESEE